MYHYESDVSPHFAVVTKHGDTNVGTEQWGGRGTKTLDIDFDPKEPNGMDLVGVYKVKLPNARAAQQHQNDLIRQGEYSLSRASYDPSKLDTPVYCPENQSCLTHVFDVLNAGGRSAPTTSPSNMTTARYIRGLQRESKVLSGDN